MKSNPEDFKTFRLPDSLEWSKLEQKLPRDQQIIYLADRLRLLNCIQLEQPGGINYDMSQFSISIKTASELNIRYWGHNAEYGVINPFLELLKMNLNPHETELLLPYLLSEDYIASYNYHRDFFPNRNLHKLSWVVNDLIYQITNQLFFKQDYFDSLTLDQKKAEVEKIKKWCDENAGLSREDMTIKTLKTTDQWIDFHKAMLTAKEEKYEALLPIIVDRFNDSQIDISRGFQLVFQPSNKGMMAETMFDIGNEKYIGAVRNWNKDTTDVWVNLFSSLFLLKYDKQSYEPAMNELESVLRQDDGTAYYPYAMDLLLSMSDKRALKLAEGILDKPQFARFMEWDYYLNFIKKLLLLKSDYTFNFISSKLGSFTPDEVAQFSQYGNTNMLMQSDFYVLAVDKLKQGNSPGYDPGKSIEIRSEYRKTLNKWFITQYNLLKEGKPNELQLNMVQVNRPQTFIDAAH